MQSTAQNTTPAPQPAKPQRPQVPPIPPEFQAAKIMQMDTPELVALLKDPASTEFQKAKACMRLAMVGTKEAVAAMAALLPDAHLSDYARFGLVPIPDPSVDDALRASLKTLKGKQLIGVVDSIGHRKDAKAIDALAAMMIGADTELAAAAASALGLISGPKATAILQGGLAKTKGPVRSAIASACLVSAEGLMAQGDRKGALALYTALSRPDLPKPVRLAAMHSTIEAERSLARPRTAPPTAAAK